MIKTLRRQYQRIKKTDKALCDSLEEMTQQLIESGMPENYAVTIASNEIIVVNDDNPLESYQLYQILSNLSRVDLNWKGERI